MNNSLKEIKEEMIEKVIDKLYKIRYMTKDERVLYKNKLISDAKNMTLLTDKREQSGLTNADDYNQTAYELYIDMLTTFGYVNKLYNKINSFDMLNKSILNTLHSTIGELNDRLDEYEAVIGSAGNPDCYVEGFRTQTNQEWDRKYYTERYGERMPLETFVKFNPEQQNITLNYTRQQNVMVYKSGVQLGEISITKQYGEGFIKARNSEEKLENAIDTSMSTYWCETILADSEMKVSGSGFTSAEKTSPVSRSFYDLPRGALCEICLTFESLAKINEITLNPFGEFPIDIVAIRYSLSDDEEDDTYDIIAPENIKAEWLKSKSIRKEYAFHFPEIQCKKLYILINQLHCIKNTYFIPKNQMFKNELWFNATYNNNENKFSSNDNVFKPLYLDRAEEDPVWRYINNKLISNRNIDINELLIENKEKYIPATKYQYTYGFYNIAPNFVEFQRTGIFVSRPIECEGPVDTVTLTTEEKHFRTADNKHITDIEFYITTKDNPSYNDWKPICPKNKEYVNHELLQLDYDYCYLRHKAVCRNIYTKDKDGVERVENIRPVVYMNDIILTEGSDYKLRLDKDNNVYAVEISNIDHFSMYTVSYMPTDSSKELSFACDTDMIPESTFEEKEGKGNSHFRLNNFPYYNLLKPESTNTFVKIIDTDNGKVYNQSNSENSSIQCVTDKQNPSESYKNFIANTGKIQYYTNGRFLYFNRQIPKGWRVEINYPSFGSRIRLKVILRRNSKLDLWMTPVLNKYKLEFTTII